MNEELATFQRSHTWDLVPLSPGANPVSCKQVYKIKIKFDGSVEWYKAHLVARKFTQEYGIDYEGTFAPVAKITSIRTLLALVAAQMNVKNVFLNNYLSIVYMQPPPDITAPPRHVCKLRQVLYGLKQAPRTWYERFH